MHTRRPHSTHFRGSPGHQHGGRRCRGLQRQRLIAGSTIPALRGATVGEVEALVADMPGGTSERQLFLNIAGARRRAAAPSLPDEPVTALATGDRVGVWGDRLGDDFLVSRHIVVPADETSVTSALIGSPAKPQTSVFVIVDVGGGSNVTNAMATSSVFSPGNNFASVYDKLSFGIMKMGGDVQGPFSYPMSTCDYNGLKNAVKPMVSGTYNHYMWYFGSKVSDCAWSGIGSEGNFSQPQSDAWYNASTGCTVLVQEVGHNMGWMHSSTLACTGATFANDPVTACKSSEYGNRMTPMGSGCGMLNAHDLWYAQLIGGCNGVKVTASGTFNLFPLETACNGIQAIQIPMITTGRMAKPEQGNNQPLKNYYLEYRTKTGLDASITSAVYVYAGDDIHVATKTSNWSWLLDMNPSTTTFDGLAAGGSFTDPNGEIKVTVMSADTTKAVVQIDVQGGAGAAPTCIDNTTSRRPVRSTADRDRPPARAARGGGAAGAGGTTGTGGATTTGSAGRGGTTGSAGRGGTTGSVGAGGSARARRAAAGRRAAPPDRPGPPGTSEARGTTGRGGTTGSAGTSTGAAGADVRHRGFDRHDGCRGHDRERRRDRNGDGRRRGGHPDGRGRKHGVRQSGRGGLGDGPVTGGCDCAVDPRSDRGGWGGALGLLGVGLMMRRRRRPSR